MREIIKKILILVFVVFITNVLWSQDFKEYLPNNSKIQYQGRISFSDSLKPKFSFPGISIKIKFEGTVVKAKFQGYKGPNPQPNYFNIFVDGEYVNKFELADTLLNIECIKDLANTEHVLEITKRTESMLGNVEFLGFEIDGDLLDVKTLPTKKIEFVGNSITCGYGNEDSPTGGFTSIYENNYLAYGAVCARELNTQYRAVAYSGRGVIYNYACSKGDSIPEVYEKYLADEPSIGVNQYDYKTYVPDIIVINLGTNDHNCNKTTDENFKAAYIDFVGKLKGYHPTAKIICLTGPMNTKQIFKDRVEYIVENSGGTDNGIYFFHQTKTIDATYKGGHGHPNTKMAEINGKELAKFISDNNLLTTTSIKKVTPIKLKKKVYPNPIRNGQLNIDLKEFKSREKIILNIYNIYNKQVYNQIINAGNLTTLDIDFTPGLYILALRSNNQSYFEKIIVK